jgi:hypothetical protein
LTRHSYGRVEIREDDTCDSVTVRCVREAIELYCIVEPCVERLGCKTGTASDGRSGGCIGIPRYWPPLFIKNGIFSALQLILCRFGFIGRLDDHGSGAGCYRAANPLGLDEMFCRRRNERILQLYRADFGPESFSSHVRPTARIRAASA